MNVKSIIKGIVSDVSTFKKIVSNEVNGLYLGSRINVIGLTT
jgi:hypothetical protein